MVNELVAPKAKMTIARMWADAMPDRFVDSFLQMFMYTERRLCDPGEYIHFLAGEVSYHELGRNLIVQKMRGDWLFMCDTDHIFAPDLCERLLRLADKYGCEVISGIYQSKHPPHNPVASLWVSDYKLSPILDWPRDVEIFEVGAVGGGALLLKKSLLTRMVNKYGEYPFTRVAGLSEDFSFCWRCKDMGVPVYLAPRVESHHIIRTALSVREYQPPMGIPVDTQDGIVRLQTPPESPTIEVDHEHKPQQGAGV